MSSSFIDLETVQNNVSARYIGPMIETDVRQIAGSITFRNGRLRANCGVKGFEDVVLTSDGFSSIFSGQDKDRIKWLLGDTRLSEDLRLNVVESMAVGYSSQPAVAVLAKHGNDFIFEGLRRPQKEVIVENQDIIDGLVFLRDQGVIPSDCKVHSWALNRRYFTVRIISTGEWTFDVDGEPFYGSLVIQNKEDGNEFFARSSIARLACMNYSIGEKIFDARSSEDLGSSSVVNIKRSMADHAMNINAYIDDISNRTRTLKQVEVEYPEEMVERTLSLAGIKRAKVSQKAEAYLQAFGDRWNTAYAVHQAVAYALQEVTAGGRGGVRWDLRNAGEVSAWYNIGVNLLDALYRGHSPEEMYLSKNMGLKHAIRKHIQGKADSSADDSDKALLAETAQEIMEVE